VRSALDCSQRQLKSTCNTGGISLSPAFVVMFVMRRCQLSWEDALHLVQNRRYCISPNGGFLTQIKVSFVSPCLGSFAFLYLELLSCTATKPSLGSFMFLCCVPGIRVHIQGIRCCCRISARADAKNCLSEEER
jgi:hypothetical protein